MKKNNIYILLGIVLIIVVWLLTSRVINNSIIFPQVDDVLVSLKNLLLTKSTYFIVFNTIFRLMITVVLAFIISMLYAFLSFISVKFENFIKPMVVIMKTIPVASIIIILLIIVGNNNSPYIITSFVIFPIMYESILTSFKSIDKDIIDDVKLISNINLKIIASVFFPITLPYIITSLIQSIGLGLKVMVMSEFIAQTPNTIGYMMLQERIYINTANIFAWTIILIVFVLLVEISIKKIKYVNK